jgi:hypothetical protein
MMVCQNIKEAMEAAQHAEKEELQGLYPSACRVMADYIRTLYRRVPLKPGQNSEPVQYAGVYVTQWGRTTEPTDAFVEAYSDMEVDI